MRIKTLLNKKGANVFHIHPEVSVMICIGILNEKRIGALMVADKDELVGIVSERDVLMKALECRGEKLEDIKVCEILTPKEQMISANSDYTIEDAMELMTSRRVRHLPIIDDGRLAGMVSIGDIVKSLLEVKNQENQHLKDYVYNYG